MKLINEVVTTLANTRCRPPHRLFGIRQSDRMFHQYIIGQTGTGKSTLLLQMMKQDIASGQGFCLVDPHGDLARVVMEIDSDKILYWNAANPACPYGYNPLTTVSAEYRPLVASGLIETLKKQWADAWGARMEHLLRYSLLALLERPRSNLQDILPMFLDKDFRREVLSHVSDTQVKQFWYREFPNMNYKSAADGVAPIANKLGAFLAHPVVRKAVCTPDQPLRFRQIMDEGKILIVNLAKGNLGTDMSNILGGMIVSSLAHAAYSRESQPELERKPFFLYIDEFHSFTTEAFANMISELRKYQLGLVLTHQYTAQLNKEVFEAILGNVGTLMAFRLGATDATIMAKQFGADVPLPRDLVNLANYDMFIKMMVDGKQCGVLSGRTN